MMMSEQPSGHLHRFIFWLSDLFSLSLNGLLPFWIDASVDRSLQYAFDLDLHLRTNFAEMRSSWENSSLKPLGLVRN